jgi:phosphoribosylaminoimidazolecarboxamide formyltransferase/IMP cyclohydrolase
MRALISVSDKTGVSDFARALAAAGLEVLSTGGTFRHLREAGIPAREVADATGFPEILDGRVKTLHPAIHGGILARRGDPAHVAQLAAHGLVPIAVVAVNLYPFATVAANGEASHDDLIENIDIGGVSLLRSAAKNHGDVFVVCEPADYARVAEAVASPGADHSVLRRELARKAFAHTAAYDAAIARVFAERIAPADDLPETLALALPRALPLRYGENPHQRAALYRDASVREASVVGARQLQGKELSYNNILDADGALDAARDFAALAPAAAVIVKHGNPCGIALGDTPAEAWRAALACDPDSAFGGIVALTAAVDGETARGLGELFLEVVIAPAYTPEALEVLARKKNVRVLETGPWGPKARGLQLRGVVGGVLAMDRDLGMVEAADLRCVTKAQPTEADLAALLFAWRCAKWVKSNAIVYADARATIGIGAGQMARVDSARIGALKARRPLAGCCLASDAFFPFRDAIDAAAAHGVRAIVQPGGSMRDAEVIAAADEHGMVMVFTGMRHFRH